MHVTFSRILEGRLAPRAPLWLRHTTVNANEHSIMFQHRKEICGVVMLKQQQNRNRKFHANHDKCDMNITVRVYYKQQFYDGDIRYVLVTRYESLWSLYLYSWLIVYSDLCCFFSLNYCFAAVVLIATNNVEYVYMWRVVLRMRVKCMVYYVHCLQITPLMDVRGGPMPGYLCGQLGGASTPNLSGKWIRGHPIH